MALSADRVEEILKGCLFDSGEDTSSALVVEGIQNRFGFKPERLSQYTPEIMAMLTQLPTEFMKSSGAGGWSFLNGCMTRDGNMWTGLQSSVDKLFVLGMAIGRVELLLPREMWSDLPGGMPYYVVNDDVPAPQLGSESESVQSQ